VVAVLWLCDGPLHCGRRNATVCGCCHDRGCGCGCGCGDGCACRCGCYRDRGSDCETPASNDGYRCHCHCHCHCHCGVWRSEFVEMVTGSRRPLPLHSSQSRHVSGRHRQSETRFSTRGSHRHQRSRPRPRPETATAAAILVRPRHLHHPVVATRAQTCVQRLRQGVVRTPSSPIVGTLETAGTVANPHPVGRTWWGHLPSQLYRGQAVAVAVAVLRIRGLGPGSAQQTGLRCPRRQARWVAHVSPRNRRRRCSNRPSVHLSQPPRLHHAL